MPVITIKTDEIGCRKPGCKHRLEVPHRHHRKSETLFIHSWKSVGRHGSKWWKDLKKRYDEFRDEDTVVLCAWHHAEIHLIYREIVDHDSWAKRKRLRAYSAQQAESLMKKLEKECLEWEKEETPGVDPDTVFIPDRPKLGRQK